MIIFLRELKRNRNAFIIWTVATILLIFSQMAVFPSFSEDSIASQEALLTKYPAALVEAFGIAEIDMSSVLGYFAVKIFPLVALIGSIYIMLLAKLTFSALRLNRVAISLYDVVKTTGEVKDTFRFTYNGRRYDRLSLSEKIRAGMEVSELMKRLTGRNYPVFVDNMESVEDLANVRPTGQVIMAKLIPGAELSVKGRPQMQPPSKAA